MRPHTRTSHLWLATSLLLGASCAGTSGDGFEEQSTTVPDDGCTLTQGYWKNHPESWPVTTLQLGTVTYTQDQLIAILKTPVRGNGLVSLAHQLIAAKLNAAIGADVDDLDGAIADADAAIGGRVVPPHGTGSLSTRSVSSLVGELDDFNNGVTGPGHCTEGPPPPPPAPYCGDGHVDAGEQCDDGNTVDTDACTNTCELCPPPPPAPYCGDGHVDAGEQCDDGNTVDTDTCNNACEICPPPPPPEPYCGDGNVDAGEQCDDGNDVNTDACDNQCVVCPPS